MPDLVIGCPIRAREWILPLWFKAADVAAVNAGLVPLYVFVIDVRDHSEVLLRDLCAAAGREIRVVRVNEDGGLVDERVWNDKRYHHMVWLRNLLLAEVRRINPRWFLSLDSDILIAPGALLGLVQAAAGYDAVGGKCYMSEWGKAFPSCGELINFNGLKRDDGDVLVTVDVIMAIKLMGPAAYAVDYRWNWHGEDIGWSLAMHHKGLTLGWDGRTTSKHCLSPAMLARVDERCGY